MHACCFRSILFLSLIFVSYVPTEAITYKVTLLHPTGFDWSDASGNTDSTQVGDGKLPSNFHALMWAGSASSVVDLNPAGFSDSKAFSASGNNQVGYASNSITPTTSTIHAMMWSGTASSAVDLHPLGYEISEALGVSGSSQVGYGYVPIPGTVDQHSSHALFWSGTAESVVDLHSAAFLSTTASAVAGNNQAGTGLTLGESHEHALLWHGTPDSIVDLNPAGFSDSEALGTSESNQVGFAHGFIVGTGIVYHAMLWGGSAASAVDLHPPGYSVSEAFGVSGNTQVGYGFANLPQGGTAVHALAWNGTAASYTDLQPFVSVLDPTFTNSEAYGVSANGVIVGVAYRQFQTQVSYAVMWTPVEVPEPTSMSIVAIAIASGLILRMRSR